VSKININWIIWAVSNGSMTVSINGIKMITQIQY